MHATEVVAPRLGRRGLTGRRCQKVTLDEAAVLASLFASLEQLFRRRLAPSGFAHPRVKGALDTNRVTATVTGARRLPRELLWRWARALVRAAFDTEPPAPRLVHQVAAEIHRLSALVIAEQLGADRVLLDQHLAELESPGSVGIPGLPAKPRAVAGSGA